MLDLVDRVRFRLGVGIVGIEEEEVGPLREEGPADGEVGSDSCMALDVAMASGLSLQV